jgi:hypothetical protein
MRAHDFGWDLRRTLAARKRCEGEHKMVDATPLIFPQLGPIYEALFPWAEVMLRAVVGLTLVPHGLRSTFGMFPSTGAQSHTLTEFANELDRDGYHPGKFWAPAIVLTQLVAMQSLRTGAPCEPNYRKSSAAWRGIIRKKAPRRAGKTTPGTVLLQRGRNLHRDEEMSHVTASPCR